MKKIFIVFASFILIFFLFSIGFVSANDEENIYDGKLIHDDKYNLDYINVPVNVNYTSSGRQATFKGVYSDDVFYQKSNIYNHFLAKMSIEMAISSFQLEVGDLFQVNNGAIAEFLFDCGFDNIRVEMKK